MSKIASTLKTFIAAATVAGSALVPMATPAAADDYRHGGYRGPSGGNCVFRHGERYCGVREFRRAPRPVHRNNDGDAAAAAIIGLAGVAIIAGALANANQPPVYDAYPAPSGGYYPPAPAAPRGPKVITYASTLEPWTRDWYEWCDDRYRSFNPETGTYRGYDGRDHFCVPK